MSLSDRAAKHFDWQYRWTGNKILEYDADLKGLFNRMGTQPFIYAENNTKAAARAMLMTGEGRRPVMK